MRLLDRRLAGALALAAALAGGESAGGHQSGTAEQPAIRLYGVVRQGDGGVALLRFAEGRPLALRVGAVHRGFTVLRVLDGGVELKAPGGEVLEVGLPESLVPPEIGKPSAARETPVDTRPPVEIPAAFETAPDPPPGEVQTPPPPPAGERAFSRDDVRLRLQSELPRILSSAVVAPRVVGNEIVGLELVAFPTDTVLGETGLVPGDVLLEVNGRAVRGAESLAVLVQRFQTASQVELMVDRDGEVFPIRYRIE
ncbi:MAG: hypothetical protein OXU35_10245 [Acidobacteriota bacterium]|nr:hypothetical protein [Acidobacteriota bacterium]MDE3260388.1 hypothetical protein [Acidobacteriota bacterium]